MAASERVGPCQVNGFAHNVPHATVDFARSGAIVSGRPESPWADFAKFRKSNVIAPIFARAASRRLQAVDAPDSWFSVLRSAPMNSTEHDARVVPEDIVYPGAPLKAVAIEVNFAPLLDAHARIGVFQRTQSSDFPDVVLPEERRADPELSRRRAVVLLGEDRAIALGRDLVAIATYKYEGFRDFVSWALPLLRDALKAIEPPTIESVRYRYENVIKMPRGGAVEIGRVLRVGLPQPTDATGLVRNVHLFWKTLWPSGVVDVSVESCSPPGEVNTVEMSITGEPGDEHAGRPLEERVAEARRMARLTFEQLITDEYRRSALNIPKEEKGDES